jgi:hypothetical protein
MTGLAGLTTEFDATGLSGVRGFTAAWRASADEVAARLADGPMADLRTADAHAHADRRDADVLVPAIAKPAVVLTEWRGIPAAGETTVHLATAAFARTYQRKANGNRPIACRGPSVTTEPPV